MQEAIFDKIPGRHKPIFTFIKETGCRPGEARAIWKEDINLKEKTAIIRRSFSDNEYREFTKTKTQRVIPLSEELVKTLKSLSVISGFLFLNPKGKPYNRTALGEIFNTAKKKVGIESDLTVYQWGRHSFASQAINRGVPENLVGAFLGHTDSRTTKKYAHANLEGLKKVIDSRKSARVIKMKKDKVRPQKGPRKIFKPGTY